MTTATFDTLRLSQKLRDRAKYTPEQAEGTAEVLAETFTEWQEQIVTKEHLVTFKSEMKNDFATLRNDFEGLRKDMQVSEARLEAKIESGNAAVMKYMFSGFVTIVGLLIAAIAGILLKH